MGHHVFNFSGVGIGGRAKAARQKAMVTNHKYQSGWSYEVALAGGQHLVYGPLLTELGFECKMTSTNPNTGNRIEGWFKSVE